MFTLMALLALMATGASAQNLDGKGSFIGLFADVDHSVCQAPITEYVNTSVYIYAAMDISVLTQCTAVEFKLGNLPTAGAQGLITATWNSPLVISDGLDINVAVAFELPQDGPVVLIGQLDFFPLDAGWIGADHVMTVEKGDAINNRVIVGADFEKYDSGGGSLTFNCGGVCLCMPTTAVEETNWGSIKALY